MGCQKFKRLIPDFLEGQLSPKANQELSQHLLICKDCTRERMLYEESWKLMGQLKDIEPQPGFKMRFWNRLVAETEAKKAPILDIFRVFQPLRVALATAVAIIIAVSIVLPNYLRLKSTDQLISRINDEDITLVENIDLLENLEIIQDLDFLENLELIENLDNSQLNNA